MLGLGSILGTGVFVSLALGADIAGGAVVLCIVLASGVAMCNGLSSAQLAANFPVSGGTYEYGYETVNHWFGFAAGWMFLCAKSASAAAAAIGFAGYLWNLGAMDSSSRWPLVAISLAAVATITVLVLSGIRRSALIKVERFLPQKRKSNPAGWEMICWRKQADRDVFRQSLIRFDARQARPHVVGGQRCRTL